MAYQALYRQWRPQTFSAMVGQEHIIATLRNQVAAGRISHAYLFCGSRGTGKTSTAKIFARAVNCLNSRDGDACGECESCRRLLAGESLDIMEIDAASNNGVDQVRDLRDNVSYPPQFSRYKVYIIDEVHMLSANAFNALLKTLEEPPAHVIFILATTEPQKLPATILSRCQRFDFSRIPARQIAARLREVVDALPDASADDQALMTVARAAEGGMRDALSILDMCLAYSSSVDDALVRNVLGTADKAFLFRFGEALAKEDAAGLLKLIDELMRSGREPLAFSRDVSRHIRALLLAACCPQDLPALLDITKEDAEDYIRQANAFSRLRLTRIMELFMDVETSMRWSSSPRLALEDAAVRACIATAEPDISELADEVAHLREQVRSMSVRLTSGAALPAQAPPAAPAKAPKPAAAPKAKPAARPAAAAENSDVWKAALVDLKRSSPMAYALLNSSGRFLGAKDNVYSFEVSNATSMHLLERSRDTIAASLTQAAGESCTFSCTLPAAPEKQGDDGFLNDLRTTFGAENVMVK